jgi:L-rhamnose mutarotase
METIQFEIDINADKQKVWNTMLEDATYREWTSEFNAGSYYEGNWNKGSEIRFVGLDKNDKLQGIFSRIAENKHGEFISIQHLGLIVDGIPDNTSEEAKKWTPSFENYTFTSDGNGTHLVIEMQVEAEYKNMFEEMWPRALKALKILCEK